MGEAAARDADLAIVTSDNPRTEDPDAILDMILAGVRPRRRPELDARALGGGARLSSGGRSPDRDSARRGGLPRPATCC